MRKIKIIILLLTLNAFPIYSVEQSKLDTLISSFESTESDTEKWILLTKINKEIDNSVPKDSVLDIWNKLITICQRLQYENGEFRCQYNKAQELRDKGNYFESLQLFTEVLKYFEEIDSLRMVANVHNSLGIFYKYIDDYNLSETHYTEGMKIREQLKDSVGISWFLINLGSLAEKEEKYDKAIKYYRMAEIILKRYDQINLINCYINFGDVYNKKQKFDSAYHYLSLAYQLALKANTVEEQFHSSFHLGQFLFDIDNKEDAEVFILKAENIEQINVISDFSLDDQIRYFNLLRTYYSQLRNDEKAYKYADKVISLEAANKKEQFQIEQFRLNFEKQVLLEETKRKRSELINGISFIILFLSIIFIILLYRNYKHKQKANRLLTEMDDLKTKLFSNISHELRTPLTLILAPLEQMLSKEAEKAPSRKQIKQMRKNANAILELVNQMLDLSKIDAKSMKQELVNSDIVSFIRAHFAAFSTLAKQKDINFNSYTPPDKKLRLFDASKLEKIINNLVSNALKYTPEGGQVFCFANFPKPNLLELIIQDTGKGIQPEELSRIFDRFHQVSNSTSQQNIGTGIGLSLTKELVELMYGQISVESIVGEGSKFKVSLPLGKEHLQNDEYVILENYSAQSAPVFTDDEETPNCDESPKASRENLPELLIVEDHPEISEFIRENLRACYQVETAANGKLGFEMATELIPDLIISDVMMPEMDGIEMSRKIKADERTSHIPIILLTGKASHADKMQGLETGVDAFVPKPFNMKELRLRIEKIIEQRQKLRERFTKNLKLEPKDIAVSSADEKFIDKVMELIEKNMSNTEFEVNQLQDELLMSRTQLFRKIKALTNQSPGEFIRTIRLKRAASLMDQKFGNIAQITYEVGFNNPSYFAKCFKELFGMLPSEYIKKE
ncbi:response regulator [Maribellus sediminis]|uniref:hybrid sensor histidine kinase/response regulator transcription factor n=1 Tax=Maribellus sediminis TaxID=2696285 RepID=UPI0014304165|nr:response regulator [Maribellus sediminis]